MAERENPLKKFNDHVDEYLKISLECALEEVNKLLESGEINPLIDKVVTANSLISFMCGEDEDSYDDMRIRLFRNPSGQLLIVQGFEEDVDIRMWQEVQDLDKNADDNGDLYEYEDDETDMSTRDGQDFDEDMDDDPDSWPE